MVYILCINAVCTYGARARCWNKGRRTAVRALGCLFETCCGGAVTLGSPGAALLLAGGTEARPGAGQSRSGAARLTRGRLISKSVETKAGQRLGPSVTPATLQARLEAPRGAAGHRSALCLGALGSCFCDHVLGSWSPSPGAAWRRRSGWLRWPGGREAGSRAVDTTCRWDWGPGRGCGHRMGKGLPGSREDPGSGQRSRARLRAALGGSFPPPAASILRLLELTAGRSQSQSHCPRGRGSLHLPIRPPLSCVCPPAHLSSSHVE